MRRTEDAHHSPEQVRGYIETALAICDEQGFSEEWRLALLPTLVTLLSAKQIFYEQVAPMGLALPGGARH